MAKPEGPPPEVVQSLKNLKLQAEAEVDDLDAAHQERMATAPWPESGDLMEEYCIRRFDLIAEHSFPLAISGPGEISPAYDAHLKNAVEAVQKYLDTALAPLRQDLRADLISKVMLRLSGRRSWWLGETKRRLAGLVFTPSTPDEDVECASPEPTSQDAITQPAPPSQSNPSAAARFETIAEQLRKLREESRLTIEALATALGIDTRSVERHLADKTAPRIGHIGAYERAFSEAAKRKIVISKMPVKRR